MKLNQKAVALTLALTVLSTQARPRQAHAVIGAFSANPVVVNFGIGCFVVAGGALVYAFVAGAENDREDKQISSTLFFIAGVLGLVLLDADGQSVPAFAPVSGHHPELGSAAQIEAYNHEVEELNSIRESVQAEANALVEQGKKFGVRESGALWSQYVSGLNPDTVLVAGRIMKQSTAKRTNP